MAGFDNDVAFFLGADTRNVEPVANQMTDGTLLIGRTSADSNGSFITAATLSAGANVSIVNGPGSITISAAGGGGGGAQTNLSVDATSGTGTDPVVPDGGDVITITGGQAAAGTTTNVLRTISTAANSLTLQIQRATASASSTVGNNGVSHFNSTRFTVDANGFVDTAPVIPLSFAADTGTAEAAANIVNLIGGTNGIDTTAAGNTVTFNFDVSEQPAIPTSVGSDAGTATPAANTFSIVGTNGVTTSATGSTVTIDGSGAGGGLVQQVRTQTTTHFNLTGEIPFDDTIPQQTEGTEIMTLSITPQNAANILVIEATVVGSNSSASSNELAMALFQDATADAKAAAIVASVGSDDGINPGGTGVIRFFMTAGTTDATTFKIRCGQANNNDGDVNGFDGARIYGGVSVSSLYITEYSA